MLSILHTRVQLSKIIGLLVFVMAFILPTHNIYSQHSNLSSSQNNFFSHEQFSEDGYAKTDIPIGHSNIHARIFAKTKIKYLAKKFNVVQNPETLSFLDALRSTRLLLNTSADITKPAYYLFLFRYTLF